jgi:hypothetical protein
MVDINKDIEKLLKDKNLFDLTIKELDKEVVGEIPARKVLLLCANGRLVSNANNTSYNLLVNDLSGVGKDHLCNSIGELLPKEDVYIKRTRISPKVLNYWHTGINEDYNFNGKILYLEDVSKEILNNEVMRTYLSSGSHITVLKDQIILDKELKGKPIVFLTTATVNPKHELLRRLNILTLDSSINQTKEIAKRKCRMAKLGKIEEINSVFIKAFSVLQRVKVKIPYADKIEKWIDKIPNENVSVLLRTQITTFLDYIKSNTAFYQCQRKIENGYYIATKQDYEIAREVFSHLLSNPTMTPLTKQQQMALDVIKALGGDVSMIAQPNVIDKISFWEERNSYKQLNKLVDLGILDKDKDTDYITKKSITTLKIRQLSANKLPEFNEL